MNRDEKLTRPPGLPPSKTRVNGRVVICPCEPGGGTWIAMNDSGVTLALINWYSVASRVQRKAISRGEVVMSAGSTVAPADTDILLRVLPLGRINPFRLIGIFPATQQVCEWRWNLNRLVRKKRPWKHQQWISSGFDEPTAQCVRSKIFRNALHEHSAGSLAWLRRLHKSHSPQPGPFSTCMHRTDATTVSYTEIAVSSCSAKMSYHSGPTCTFPNAFRTMEIVPWISFPGLSTQKRPAQLKSK